MDVVTTSEPIRLVQISDTHLEPDEGGTLLGMDTDRSLRYVLDLVQRENAAIDLVLATGDISTHGTPQAYQRFARYMQQFAAPVVWLPGNHDDNGVMADHCGDRQAMAGHVVMGRWLVIMLDSTIPRQVGGRLEHTEIQRMRQLASEYSDKHILIACHHPPLSIDCEWIDPQRISNGEAFLEAVVALPNVKLLICGHIHQHWETTYRGLPIMSTPSTCIQFKPLEEDFTLDTVSPGYRWFDLFADGSFQTGISRVQGVEFTFDMNSGGY
ncbi:MAG TPA: 3',5'-cyclic-AMP phosphodiesterase [Pseudomonadales bacterium]|nr:3',5'-cyclic-AMP phosphodiesterase [Pseudomonadales bacterium]